MQADSGKDNQAERRRLARRLIAVQEEQRLRLSRELHDDLGQMLASVALELHTIRADSAELDVRLSRAAQLVDQLSTRVHDAAWSLRPADLDRMGLRASVEDLASMLCAQLGIPCDVDLEALSRPLEPEVALTLYRIAQEALTNIGKHARPDHVSVTAHIWDNKLRLTVEDNGRGFDSAVAPGSHHLGLAGMKERLALIGGELTVETAKGRGTAIYADVRLTA
ncbi:sensor histidine kinase [Mesorhizobium sp.]|uniref:sensor histidine kinase n=1 Tax=Mesorhizobium sp. TaxID=1871066 RepID=UPI000FE381D6|nr:sensor histidine kinase [Mesorhizobium sp.]RWA72002.1 MAG: sensor histidine kinase [Mesorhizobium sp.]RWC05465.1 MAG: sensor histidine kinase [Mesorhizobium sp.]RWG84356.1 MAG: sensor histidine kinase [Mesorhizobium sp.]RWG89416.1 MAG: sensor histidine kinase [Mesorhizobium sp.]RWK11443.1 MAG: sensor histidine kinase [Mesorhizobium sp.]